MIAVTTTEEQPMNVAELAVWLKCSKDTIYARLQSGDIPGFRVGSAWRAFPSEVRAKLTAPKDPWERSSHSRARRRAA